MQFYSTYNNNEHLLKNKKQVLLASHQPNFTTNIIDESQ